MTKDPKKTNNLCKNLQLQTPQWVAAPLRRVDFQYDTVAANSSALGGFSPETNGISISIMEGNDEFNNNSNNFGTLAHEQKHRDNHTQGIKDYNMSLEQHYKIECIDEISANICELLQWREQYINAKTDAERKAIVNHEGTQHFDYYFNAVKEGKINPFSNNPKDQENEMRFIGQETQNMWMLNYAQKYDNVNANKCRYYYLTNSYNDLKDNNENYQKARKIALGNIGGVDFTKYMDDIKCHNYFIQKISQMVNNNVNSMITKNALNKVCSGSITRELLEKYEKDAKEWEPENGYHDMYLLRKLSTNRYSPQYDTSWTPSHRVSPVQHTDIPDFTQPFLQQRMTQTPASTTADRINELRGLRSSGSNGIERTTSYTQQIVPQQYSRYSGR